MSVLDLGTAQGIPDRPSLFLFAQDKKKRSVKIDQKRKAAVNAVQWFDRVVGRHPNWVNPPGGTRRCRSEAWGHVSCARFAKATKDNSPFSKVDMMCWDEVESDMRKLVGSPRYTGAGIVWKPSAASTPHTMFCKLGDMELLYLGTIASPAIAVGDGEPTQAHFDNWDKVEQGKVLPFEGTQGTGGAAVSASAAAVGRSAAVAASSAAVGSTAAGSAGTTVQTVAAGTAAGATNSPGSASASAENAAGTGADTCAATGSCSGDGGCVPICPPVDLLEDEDDEDIDL